MSDDDKIMKRVRELQAFKAPARLQEKLLAIPKQHERPAYFMQRFKRVAPLGFAAAAAILLYLHLPPMNSGSPEPAYSREDIEAARRELALAFHYLNDVSQQTGTSVNHRVTDFSTRAIYKGVLYPVIDEDKNTESGEQQ